MLNIILFITFIVAILFFVLYLILGTTADNLLKKENTDKTINKVANLVIFKDICSIIAISSSIVFLGFFIFKAFDTLDKYEQTWEATRNQAMEMIANDCDVYIDSQLVDADKLILENYTITIKDDFIILSR